MVEFQSTPLTKGWSFCEVKPLGPLDEIKPAPTSVFNYPVTPGARLVTAPNAPNADLAPSDTAILALARQHKKEWYTVESIPSEVHAELRKLSKIPDHRVGMHEWDIQWVSESAWVWKTTFEVPKGEYEYLDLVFDGLDTICHVFVDDEKVLLTSNMFAGDVVPLNAPLWNHLAKPGKHELVLYFESAFRKARALEGVYGSRIASHNHGARVYLRKAQYNWQWDWGPRLLTVGPCSPIRLEAYDTKIDNVYARADVREDLSAVFKVSVEVKGGTKDFELEVQLADPSGETLKTDTLKVDNKTGQISWEFDPGELELWWPWQLGSPALHIVTVTAKKAGKVLDNHSTKTGVRRVRLIQEGLIDQPGKTWLFEINNVRVFLAGSNWIPADNIPTDITDKRYADWLELLVEGGQNVVRIWGGGIYEPDVFYELCDEKGILVMHDFMFACGQYPNHEAFATSVEKEVRYQLRRLRNHPSIIFWAGNNEDYQKMEFFEKYDATKQIPADRDTEMPARVLNEELFPRLIEELMDPAVPYQPSSPFQGRWVNDPTIGDSHMWRVWSGDKQPYQNWDQLSARFVSEFGFHGFPNQATVKHFLDGADDQAFPNSMLVEQHNKGGPPTLWGYLADNVRFTMDLEGFGYATQLIQAECLDQAYRIWMRNFKGRGREYTAGAVVWQLNDCWPCISWSIADYFLRRKPAFYTMKRALAPQSVSVKRTLVRRYPDYASTAYATETPTIKPYYLSAAHHVDQVRVDVWGFNTTLTGRRRGLRVETYDIVSGKVLSTRHEPNLSLSATRATDLLCFNIDPKTAGQTVVSVRLVDGDKVVTRHCSWPEPLKFINLPLEADVGLKVVADKDGIRVSAQRPVKGFVIDHADEVRIEDNCLDLMPGDPQEIACTGLTSSSKLTYRYYGSDGSHKIETSGL